MPSQQHVVLVVACSYAKRGVDYVVRLLRAYFPIHATGFLDTCNGPPHSVVRGADDRLRLSISRWNDWEDGNAERDHRAEKGENHSSTRSEICSYPTSEPRNGWPGYKAKMEARAWVLPSLALGLVVLLLHAPIADRREASKGEMGIS